MRQCLLCGRKDPPALALAPNDAPYCDPPYCDPPYTDKTRCGRKQWGRVRTVKLQCGGIVVETPTLLSIQERARVLTVRRRLEVDAPWRVTYTPPAHPNCRSVL